MKKNKNQRTTKPCEKCKENLWKTKIKNKVYECRYCGFKREIKEVE